MSCALTTGYTQDSCGDGIGGIAEVYVIARADVSFTETTGVITTVTNATGKRWWKYILPRETSSFKTTLNTNVQNGSQFYAHEVQLIMNRMKSATRNELKLLSKNNLCFIGKDHNGVYWLLGRTNGLDVTGGEATTGTASGDRNGYARTLTGNEPEDMIEVNSSLIAGLETAGL